MNDLLAELAAFNATRAANAKHRTVETLLAYCRAHGALLDAIGVEHDFTLADAPVESDLATLLKASVIKAREGEAKQGYDCPQCGGARCALNELCAECHDRETAPRGGADGDIALRLVESEAKR